MSKERAEYFAAPGPDGEVHFEMFDLYLGKDMMRLVLQDDNHAWLYFAGGSTQGGRIQGFSHIRSEEQFFQESLITDEPNMKKYIILQLALLDNIEHIRSGKNTTIEVPDEPF